MKYTKPIIKFFSVESSDLICSSQKQTANSSKYYVPEEVKELYSGMTFDQKAAAMSIMFVLAGSCPPDPAAISQIDKIMGIAANSMGISASQYKSRIDSFGSIQGMVNVLKGVHDKVVLESLFLSYMSVVKVGKSEQAMQALLNIYSQLGYAEEDCINIIKKTNALSQAFR